MKITFNIPPGFTAITPFDRQRHAGLGLLADRNYSWSAGLNSVFLSAVELPRAGLDFPVAFVSDGNSGEFFPVAVLGLKDRSNLFVDEAGHWRPQTYLPAYMRRYPFCLVEVPKTAESEEHKMICVQEDQLGPSLTPFFDRNGQPTDAWPPAQQLIEATESARLQTRAFTRRLEAFGLFTPFDALALPRGGGQLRLAGLYRVDERKLDELGIKELRLLMRKGELRAVYAHLLSLENFAKLMDLAVEADGRRAQTN